MSILRLPSRPGGVGELPSRPTSIAGEHKPRLQESRKDWNGNVPHTIRLVIWRNNPGSPAIKRYFH